MLALLAALLLLLAVIAAALFAVSGGRGGAGQALAAGTGSGSGSGVGAGAGTGTGERGDGPGAGSAGSGRTDAPPEADAPPMGAGGDQASEDSDAASLAAADGAPEVEPPRFGFTLPDEPAPAAKPRPAAPPGVPQGRPAGGASGGRGGGGSEFMGVQSTGKHVVYVIDFSGSMAGDRFAHTKLELKRSIERLPKDGSFLVIFFDNDFAVMPPGRLIPATAQNRRAAAAWIDQQEVRGGTDPRRAIEYALALRPETVFLMTDGQFVDHPGTIAVIDRANPDRHSSINTIAFHERAAEPELQRIARDNRGDYRYVPPPGARQVP